MSQRDADDPRCPECGEPIGMTATYCMHCSADLTAEREAADVDDDGSGEQSADDGSGEQSAGEAGSTAAAATGLGDGTLLDPDGLVDNTLTVVVGIAGGLVVGFVGIIVLAILTESGWGALVGVLAWLGATAHLVRQPTVQMAVARTAYGVAVVLVLVPLMAFAPSTGGADLGARVVLFVGTLGAVSIPAAIAAGVGYAISRFAG